MDISHKIIHIYMLLYIFTFYENRLLLLTAFEITLSFVLLLSFSLQNSNRFQLTDGYKTRVVSIISNTIHCDISISTYRRLFCIIVWLCLSNHTQIHICIRIFVSIYKQSSKLAGSGKQIIYPYELYKYLFTNSRLRHIAKEIYFIYVIWP